MTYESMSPNLALEIKISIPIPILGGTFSIQNMNNEQSATNVLVMKGLNTIKWLRALYYSARKSSTLKYAKLHKKLPH